MHIERLLELESVQLCIASPPYWYIHSEERTADYRETRDYSDTDGELSGVAVYEDMLDGLAQVLHQVRGVLHKGK